MKAAFFFCLAGLMTIDICCKKEDGNGAITNPVPWDLSGKIILDLNTGYRSGIFKLDMSSPGLPMTWLAPNGSEPQVNRNGTEIAYTGREAGKIDIFRMSISGGDGIDLTPDPSRTDSWADWSPDGSLIAFNRVFYEPTDIREGIMVMKRDGSDLRLLTDTASVDASITPRWSPDGSRIAFQERLSDDPNDSYSLYTMSPDGSTRIALDVAFAGARPLWSPDGRRIAYEKSEGWWIVLYTIDVESRQPQKVECSGNFFFYAGASWHPDGRLICSTRNPADTTYDVYLVRVPSPATATLIATGFAPVPVMTPSPDGKYVAIFGVRKGDNNFGLYVVEADGSNFKRLKEVDPNPDTFITDDNYCQWIP